MNAISADVFALSSRPGFKNARMSYVAANIASMVDIGLARFCRLIQMCCL